MQRSTRILALSCLALVLSAGLAHADAKDDAQKALLGKWSLKKSEGGIEIAGEFEFTKDGKLLVQMKAGDQEAKLDGSFKLLSDSEMEVTIKANGVSRTEKTKFKIAGDSLELIDKDGKGEKMTRVKK